MQLDRIGALIGAQRSGLTDGPYRALLRAKIRVNKSNGAPNQIIAVFVAMFAGLGAPLYTPGWVAEFTITLNGVIMPPLEAPIAALLLGQATQGGTYSVVEYVTTAPAQTLICNALGSQQGWGDLNNLSVGGALGGALAGVV